MIKAQIAVVLIGAGLLGGCSVARSSPAPAPLQSGGNCCAEGGCTATIECKDGGCVIHWKAQDGRTGDIELSCKDGECKVVRCDPCCPGSGCSK